MSAPTTTTKVKHIFAIEDQLVGYLVKMVPASVIEEIKSLFR